MNKSKKAPRNSIEWRAADLIQFFSDSNDQHSVNYELRKFRYIHTYTIHTQDITPAQQAAATTDFAKVWMFDVV